MAQLQLLGQDIRSIPENTDTQSRRGSRLEQGSSASSTLQGTPQTGSRSTGTPIPAKVTFAPDQIKTGQKAELQQQRYWNEFDNPESEAGDGFVVYVDPDAPLFPGQKALARWYGNVAGLFSRRTERGRSAHTRGSHSPSIRSVSTTSSDDEADDEMSSFNGPTRKPLLDRRRRDYGALPYHNRDTHSSSSDYSSILPSPQPSTLLLLASVLILVITSFLTITSKKKLRGEVDSAVVAGIIAALCFMVIASIRWWTAELPARGDLIDSFDLRHRRKKTARELWRSAVRRLGDVMRVVGILVVCLGSALLLRFALR